MKHWKQILLGSVVLALALMVVHATITQTASSVEKKLPRIEFYDQVNNAVSDLTKTDVPAIISDVNTHSGTLTNLDGSAITSGNIAQARLTNAMPTMAALGVNNGASLTNLNGTSIASGNIAQARLTNAMPTIAALGVNNGASLTNLNGTAIASGNVGQARLTNAMPTIAALAVNDAQALTNLNGSAVASGTVPNARLDSDLQSLAVNDGQALTNLNAANIVEGTVISAINAGAATNLAAGNLASGTVPNARLDTDLQSLAVNDGQAVTNLNGAYIATGHIGQDRLTNAMPTIAALAINDAQALTNLNGSAVASGTVPNARLDADLQSLAINDGQAVTNLNASALASGTVPLARGGAGNASGILKADGAGLVSAAAPGTDYLVVTNVWGYPGLSTVGVDQTNTVTITAKDTAGSTLAGFRLFHVWVSESDKGAASTNNITALTLSGGTAISTVTANADYWYCSAVAGTATARITHTIPDSTNFIMTADGSSISSLVLISAP